MPDRHICYQTFETIDLEQRRVRVTFETRRFGYYQIDYLLHVDEPETSGLERVKGEPRLANFNDEDIRYMRKICRIVVQLARHGPPGHLAV